MKFVVLKAGNIETNKTMVSSIDAVIREQYIEQNV